MILTLATFLAPITATLMLTPQIYSTWKIRNNPTKLKGISVPTQLFILVNSILWLLMGIELGQPGISAPSYFSIPIIIFTLAIVYKNKNKDEEKPKEMDVDSPQPAVL